MIDSHKMIALQSLKIHEGYRQFIYLDSVGIETCGFGRNLKDKGLSEREAEYLLRNDINEAEQDLVKEYNYYPSLSTARKAVLINMVVNLGATKFRGFKKMHNALNNKDYKKASIEMLDSKWSQQVGNRSIQLAKIMEEEYLT